MLSRVVTYVLLFLFGVVIGGVGTIVHQTTFTAGIAWPWALVLSLVAYTSLLVGLRMLGSRIPALIAALGTILTVLLFTQKSAGGSVLIPNNVLGQVWLAAPIVLAAIVLAWPDLSRRRRGAPAVETA
ncbi:DUF6113 family protein [Leifsonia poae]|uniref:Histidinol dehydrogenase n=1 Tax=Leifsonia poae TaxID=110933 RepID=A0A9W6LZM5_9MICO|nr:DUF6113 family protein [Leifsonia poae]GLJ75812.1 hypothetical protein GCM10017584_13860 [Leifsonia poae]